MICEYVELGLDSLDNRDIAKAMLRFWQYQAEQARQHCAAVRLQVEHAHAANNEAIEEWKQSDDLGFDPRLPFSDGRLLACQTGSQRYSKTSKKPTRWLVT